MDGDCSALTLGTIRGAVAGKGAPRNSNRSCRGGVDCGLVKIMTIKEDLKIEDSLQHKWRKE